jgi:hypothetical protein
MKSEMGLVMNIVLGIIERCRQLAVGLPRHHARRLDRVSIAGFIGACV